MMQTIIGKPWTHIQCVGQGLLMARIYRAILHYRQCKDPETRRQYYPRVDKYRKSPYWGKAPAALGGFLILVCLVVGWPWHGDPGSSPKILNATYFALTRPIFTLGVLLILFTIFMGQFNFAKSLLSAQLLRILAKSLPISCVLIVFVIQSLFCSD